MKLNYYLNIFECPLLQILFGQRVIKHYKLFQNLIHLFYQQEILKFFVWFFRLIYYCFLFIYMKINIFWCFFYLLIVLSLKYLVMARHLIHSLTSHTKYFSSSNKLCKMFTFQENKYFLMKKSFDSKANKLSKE